MRDSYLEYGLTKYWFKNLKEYNTNNTQYSYDLKLLRSKTGCKKNFAYHKESYSFHF